MDRLRERLNECRSEDGVFCPEKVVVCICNALGFCNTYLVSYLRSEKVYGVLANREYCVQVIVNQTELECLWADLKISSLYRIYSCDKELCEEWQEEEGLLDLSQEGNRWEGGLVTEGGVKYPFGYGKRYDGNGNIVFKGYMYKGNMVCSGTEYFPDLDNSPSYNGYYYKDNKHGLGTFYDRNGAKNKIIFVNNSVHPNTLPYAIFNHMTSFTPMEPLMVSTIVFSKWRLEYLQHVFISSDSLPLIQFFRIVGLPNLQDVVFASCNETKTRVMRNYQLIIEDCSNLKDVTIGDYALNKFGICRIEKNENLETLSFGNACFENGIDLQLNSNPCSISQHQICHNFMICISETTSLRSAEQ